MSSPKNPSRRALFGVFGKAVQRAAEPVTSQPDSSQPKPVLRFRPPGSIREDLFIQQCTRCGDCATACSMQSIVIINDEMGPTIPEHLVDMCQWCHDKPCLNSCSIQLIRSDLMDEPQYTAAIDSSSCLNNMGSPCATCIETCPEEGAIVIQNDIPMIVPEHCTGCDSCIQCCPSPNTITRVPNLFRSAAEIQD